MASKRKEWWCLSWPQNRLGIWKELYDNNMHSMWLFKNRKDATEACKDWDPPAAGGPKPKKIFIKVNK